VGTVVGDAEELVADQPKVPVLEWVTAGPYERKQQHESTSGGGPGLIAGQDGS
jgi:hypothetical protein